MQKVTGLLTFSDISAIMETLKDKESDFALSIYARKKIWCVGVLKKPPFKPDTLKRRNKL